MNLMKIINNKIENIKKYDNNPRFNNGAIELVAESIKKYGFKVPIVVDKNNVIITGHTRYEASKQLNLKEIPCIVADDLSEEQINAFRLADNKVSELSTWDYEKLKDELKNINDDFVEKLNFVEELDVSDDDFMADIKKDVKKKEKEYVCPKCNGRFI